MKRFAILLTALLALAAPAAAQTFPQLTGRVVDQADLLDPAQEAALTAKLEGLETRTKRQLVVATLSTLDGYDIADYGYRLGRHWAIGQDGKGEAEKDNGAILIVAPKERKVRIEVGYGLEPVLTDGFSSSVIRNEITPRFKAGDIAGGIDAGVDSIITQIELPPEEAAKVAAAANGRSGEDVDVGAIIFWLAVFFFIILPILTPLIFGRGKRGRRYRSGDGGPVIIWGGGNSWGGGGGSSWGSGGFGGGGGDGFGGFSGGGGSFGGGGASGSW